MNFIVVVYEYNALGQVIRERNSLGQVTRYDYDAMGRRAVVYLPDGTPEDWADNVQLITRYDEAGRVVEQTDETGRRGVYTYDLASRPVKLIFDGQLIEYEYDGDGNVTKVRTPVGEVKYGYNGQNVVITAPDGQELAFQNEVGKFVGLGDRQRLEVDGIGNLTGVIDAIGNRTEYTYDENSNLISYRDARGNTTSYEYDKYGKRLAKVLPSGAREQYEYDEQGRLLQVVLFSGETLAYEYREGETVLRLNGQEWKRISANGGTTTITEGSTFSSYTPGVLICEVICRLSTFLGCIYCS